MRPRRARLLVLIALTIAVFLPSLALAQDIDAEFDRIAREAARLRGLAIVSEVREGFLTDDELRERLVAELAAEYPPADIEADARLLAAMGLIPAGTDLGSLLLDLYTEQVAGFYDPEANEMFVIAGTQALDAMGEIVYAHEVAHALQDQHFDLSAVQEPFAADDDATLAVAALVEGDAATLHADYLSRHPGLMLRLGLETVGGLVGGGLGMEQIQQAPPIVAQRLLFPYQAGLRFVGHLRRDGGWAAVDAAYADPPTTTEQILHPERYVERDEPVAITLPDPSAALPSGWAKMDENTLGEFQVGVMLGVTGRAESAAAGWDGDRYALWGDGANDLVIWQSAWDSDADAREFADALQAYDEARFGAAYADDGAGWRRLAAGERVVLIRVDGDRVSYVLAPSESVAMAVRPLLRSA